MIFPNIIKIEKQISTLNSTDFYPLIQNFKNKNSFSCLLSGANIDSANNSYFGFNPFLKIFIKNNNIIVRTLNSDLSIKQNLWLFLKKIFAFYRIPGERYVGSIGYFSYECAHYIESIPYVSDNSNIYDIVIFIFSKFFYFSHSDNLITEYSIITDIDPFTDEYIRHNSPLDIKSVKLLVPSNQYINDIKKVIAYIKEGDIYQANISNKFDIYGNFNGFDLFYLLFKLNPAPFFAYLNIYDYEIISSSPERFILVSDNRIETRPIKGTIERGNTSYLDQLNMNNLLLSKKDQSELAMIIDLLRNDIGKCSLPGSVSVSEFKRIEQYNNVYHLIGIVNSILDTNYDYIDLIRATFPGGSVTGCPKMRSMEIISEIEKEARGIYTGSIFFHAFDGYFDSNIAIRTLLLKKNHLSFRVGGGIVFDSIPDKEYSEIIHKARSILEILGIDYNVYLEK